MIVRGDTGSVVVKLQQRLSAAGYPVAADGIFGDRTYNAVREFQLNSGLAADGVVGPLTLARLEAGDQLTMAGAIAVQIALGYWQRDIYDPRRSDASDAAKLSRSAIDEMIRTGLAWTWEPAYQGDGDFEWCGAFVAKCWPRIRGALRRVYFASTYRLDRYASYRSVAGETNAGSGRQLAVLDETSTELPFAPRAGDILTIGPRGTGYGKHICLVERFSDGVFYTLEGNGNGLGPHGERQHGVIRSQRKLGALEPNGWHARRLIRPSAQDLGA